MGPRTGHGTLQGTYSQKPAENLQKSAPPKNWGRQAAGDLQPETCRKPAEINPARELGTARCRGLTPRSLQKTCRNQPRPRTGDGKRQGTYTQKPAENLQKSVPPENWGTASGRGLTARNLQKTCRNQPRPTTGDGKLQGTGQSTGPGPGPSPTSRVVLCASRFVGFTSRFVRCASRVARFTSRFVSFTSRFVSLTSRFVLFASSFASFTSRFGRCTSRVVLFTSRFGRFTSRFVCFTSRFVPPGLQV